MSIKPVKRAILKVEKGVGNRNFSASSTYGKVEKYCSVSSRSSGSGWCLVVVVTLGLSCSSEGERARLAS